MKGRRKTYVLIDRGGFGNKGAELMVNAAVEKLRASDAGYVPVIGHINGVMSPEEQQRLGLWETFMPKRNYGRNKKAERLNRLPQFMLNPKRMVALRNIDVVLDVGGFRFGDQWNRRYARWKPEQMDMFYSGLKKTGCRIVFMPQAFGPFETEQSRMWLQVAVKHAELVYAREQVSYEHLKKALRNDSRIRLSPDFTNLCAGAVSSASEQANGKVCIIPNSKMLTHSDEAEQYTGFIVTLAEFVRRSGREIFLLNHEAEQDHDLCEQINHRLGGAVSIVSGLNAKQVKGVIGASYLVISSRYHGVVSALSQGVPCLCTSWSHKYPLLLEEYECADALLLSNQHESAFSMLSKYMDPAVNAEVRARLAACSSRIKIAVEKMWDEVFDHI